MARFGPPWFLCLYFCLIVAADGCPSECRCVSRSVHCVDANLTSIPAAVPLDTVVLDLRRNHIRDIAPSSLSHLRNLSTLLLNNNHLTALRNGAFYGLDNLKQLHLYRNRIRHIDRDVFRNLTKLQHLYGHMNRIENVLPHVFTDMPSLEKLYLHHNKIKNIPAGSFVNLGSLKHLRLDSNPLVCDCNLLWFTTIMKDWVKEKKLELAATCYSPSNFLGYPITLMTDKTLKCESPVITKEPEDAYVETGSEAYFTCETRGDPIPKVIWIREDGKKEIESDRYHKLPNGTLMIRKIHVSDVGLFKCVAVNSVGEVKSRTARMIVHEKPTDNNAVHHSEEQTSDSSTEQPLFGPRFAQPYVSLGPSDQSVHEGESQIALHCEVVGIPQPHIQWYHNYKPMLAEERFRILPNGTLLIKNVIDKDGGVYTCHAENHQYKISTSATVKILAPPRFITMPSMIKAAIGERVSLTCKARGSPKPTITWLKDGIPLSSSGNIDITDNYQVITFLQITEENEGTYNCQAENTEGFIEVSATVEVADIIGTVPKLIHKPYDIDTSVGSSIEIPCRGSGNPHPDIEWRLDGSILVPSTRRKISSFGSLYIYNITSLDTGRYECSAFNVHGRDTASGVLSISDEALPGDQFVRSAFQQAVEDVDTAIKSTIDQLFSHNKEDHGNHGDLFRLVRYPKGTDREAARSAEIYERTLVLIREKLLVGAKLNLNSTFDYKDVLSPDHLDLIAQLSGCTAHRTSVDCSDVCFHNKYRNADGSCNNFEHPTWGSSLTGFRRLLPAVYENGFTLPVGWSKDVKYNGHHLPSARKISTELISTNVITQDNRITHMVMQWGQWLDHDLDHALPSVSSQSWDGIDCKKSCDYAAPCFPMDVPPNDPRIHNRRCIDFVRTSSVCGSGMTSVFFNEIQPREQINQLTSFIDSSQVYGFSRELAQDLRDLSTDNGELRVGSTFPGWKPLLPFAGNQGVDCRRNPLESSINCFVAGDIRANEQVGLTAMHTIFMREHNRLVKELRTINPFWTGETLYQEARKIVGAITQFITYKHWLPIILGSDGMKQLGNYEKYDSKIDPSISNVFATAALRFGHTLINPELKRYDEHFETIPQGHLPLNGAFFSPWRIVEEGGIDPLLRGMFMTAAKLKTPMQNLNEELTEKLFYSAHAVALDLAAMNIQRGRDHAIPPYLKWRKFCNMSDVHTFEDLRNEISNREVRDKLKKLYGTPENIDVFVGGILEDQVEGGKVGPLFRCILVEQFRHLRDGDRFWYESPNTFKPEQLYQIQRASLTRLLCDNGDNIDTISEDVFLLPDYQDGLVDCEDVPSIDLRFWADCGDCNNVDIESVRAKRNAPVDMFNMDITWSEKRLSELEISYVDFRSKMENMLKRIEILETKCNNN